MFVRIDDNIYNNIRQVATKEDRSITKVVNRLLSYALLAYPTQELDNMDDALANARPLTGSEKKEVDAAIEGLKDGKTKLEFAPGWNKVSHLRPVTVMGTPADTWVTQDIKLTPEEQEELGEIEAAIENGTAVDVMTPESKAAVEEAARNALDALDAAGKGDFSKVEKLAYGPRESEG